jgi:hypothetical protein
MTMERRLINYVPCLQRRTAAIAAIVLLLLINLVLLTAFFMSVFFANSFDTGFIITRTIVDGLLFLILVLICNTLEHYVLHTINEHLEINDAFVSSLLSGVLVLVISPLHHRLNHFLTHKFRHNKGNRQTED